jgi:hypothetical protein
VAIVANEGSRAGSDARQKTDYLGIGISRFWRGAFGMASASCVGAFPCATSETVYLFLHSRIHYTSKLSSFRTVHLLCEWPYIN